MIRALRAVPLLLLGWCSNVHAQNLSELGGTVFSEISVLEQQRSALGENELLDVDGIAVEAGVVLETEVAETTIRVRPSLTVKDGEPDVMTLRLLEVSRLFDIASNMIAFAGKRILAWDPGLSFQPTGFFQQQANFTDLTDNFGRAEGLPMIGATIFGDGLDLTVLYSNDFTAAEDGYNRGLEQFAANLTVSVPTAEVSFILQKPVGQDLGVGLTASIPVNDQLLLYGTSFVRAGTNRPINVQILTGLPELEFADPIGRVREDENRLRTRFLLGLSATLFNDVGVTLEYNHDGRGLSNSEWRSYLSLIDFYKAEAIANIDARDRKAAQVNLLYLTDTLVPSGARRNYAFLRIARDQGRLSLSSFLRFSIDDSGLISGLVVERQFGDFVLGARLLAFSGCDHCEFGLSPISKRVSFSIIRRF